MKILMIDRGEKKVKKIKSKNEGKKSRKKEIFARFV